MFKYALVLLMLCSNSIYCAALSEEKKDGLAHGQLVKATKLYVEATKLYKENFGDPAKLFKFEKKKAKKVGATANVVLANLALYVEGCIEQKDAHTARQIMELFQYAQGIQLESLKSSSHEDLDQRLFDLWPKIRALEEGSK